MLLPEDGSPKFQDENPPLVEISVNVTVEFVGKIVEGEIVKSATGLANTVIIFVIVVVPVQLFKSVQVMVIEYVPGLL